MSAIVCGNAGRAIFIAPLRLTLNSDPTTLNKEDQSMSLFIEFHLIQNFAPSNLNRDDTGSPKDAIFGGQRRARVSSQCFKRAIRLTTGELDLIPSDYRGVRTKKLKALSIERLDGREDRKSTRLNSSHVKISYAVFCLKKKKSEHTTSNSYI